MRNKRNPPGLLVLKLFIVFCPVFGLYAEETPFPGLNSQDRERKDRGMLLFSQAVDKVWSGNFQTEEISQLLDKAETDFRAIRDAASRNYLLAQIELCRGRALLMVFPKIKNREKIAARTYLENAMEMARESLNLYESADCYRVLADAGAAWMVTKGLVGIIKMAPNVKKWSDKAIAINSDNALAAVISSQGQIHAPKSSGGDPRKAVRRLTELISRTDLDNVERFRACSVLVQAHKKLKENDKSAYYCEEARSIFPNNPFLEQLCRQ